MKGNSWFSYKKSIIRFALEKGEMGLSQEYDRFLIGYETFTRSVLEETFGVTSIDDLSENQLFKAIDTGIKNLNPGDVSREDIIENLPEGMEADYSPDLDMRE
jgi:hypothetical protein